MPKERHAEGRLRVALLEPEPIRAEGFHSLFGRHPRLEFVNVDLGELLADEEFGVALIGLHGENLTSALISTIRGMRPTLRLVVMGPEVDDETILAIISAGAKAYLEETATPEQVEQAIEIVRQGSIWAPRRVLSTFVDRATQRKGSSAAEPQGTLHFTAREKQVLELLVAARSNREIAATLKIEERTVKAHIAKLMRKVGVENRIALSIYAVTHGIVVKAPQ